MSLLCVCLRCLPGINKNQKSLLNNLRGREQWKCSIYAWAKSSFILTSNLNSKLCLLPFDYDKLTKRYTSGSLIRRTIAYSFFTFHTLHTIFKLCMIIKSIADGQSGFEIGISVSIFLGNFGGWCLYMVAHVRPTETKDLLNSWVFLLSCLPTRPTVEPFDGIFGAIKVAALAPCCLCVASIAIALPGFFRIYGTYSVIARNVNLPFPHAFFPLEAIIFICAMILTAFSASMVVASAERGKVFLKQIRSIKLTNVRTRASVESLYGCGKVYERVLANFIGFMVPFAIFGISCCIIMLLLDVIRFSEMPMVLRESCMYVACTEVLTLSAVSWDYFMLTRLSDEVLWNLQSDSDDDILRLSREKREEVLKRSRFMRAWRVPVGPFTTFSMDVPTVVNEEILNQLLFFLSR